MIDAKKWGEYMCQGGLPPLQADMLEALGEKFQCPRCGRPDLPLALFPHHNKSCAFECALGEPAIERIERDNQLIDDLKHRIEQLEASVRDGINTIQWFGRWLNNREEPVAYDSHHVPCKECGVVGKDHSGECQGYVPSSFSVSYTSRNVAQVVNSMCKTLGPEASPKWTEFRCDLCQGLFDREHVYSDPDFMGVKCTWCKRSG